MMIHVLADSICLEDKGEVDGDSHQQRENCANYASYVCLSWNVKEVAAKGAVEIIPIAGEEEGEEECAKGTKEEGENVEDEHGLPTFCRLSEAQDDEKHDGASSDLSTIIDAAGDTVPVVEVDIYEGYLDWCDAVRQQDRDRLGERIKGGVGCRKVGYRGRDHDDIVDLVVEEVVRCSTK